MHPADKARYLADIADWRVESSDLNPPGMNPPSSPEDPDVQELTSRQYAIYEFMRSLVDVYGKFDQSVGPDNARYMDSSTNPFQGAQMMCGTCVFYTGGGCDLVNGDIQAAGLCQYALIPEFNIVDAVQEATEGGQDPAKPAQAVRKMGSVTGAGANPFPPQDARPGSYY